MVLDIVCFNVILRFFLSIWFIMVCVVVDVDDNIVEGIEVGLREKEGRFVGLRVVVWEGWWDSKEFWVVYKLFNINNI